MIRLSAAGRAGLGLNDVQSLDIFTVAFRAGMASLLGRALWRRHLELMPAFVALILPGRWSVRADRASYFIWFPCFHFNISCYY